MALDWAVLFAILLEGVSTGEWVGEGMMRERLGRLENEAAMLRACLGESGWPIPDA
jgi:hypothetical protein